MFEPGIELIAAGDAPAYVPTAFPVDSIDKATFQYSGGVGSFLLSARTHVNAPFEYQLFGNPASSDILTASPQAAAANGGPMVGSITVNCKQFQAFYVEFTGDATAALHMGAETGNT